MTATASKPIAIVGFMGSGKTTIGRLLARCLKLDFFDTDRAVEEHFGLTIAEIFERRGEQAFRAAERETIASHLAGPPRILSLGGGAFADPQTRGLLKSKATTVWLDPPFALILERVSRSDKRPLARNKSPDELRRLWDERRKHYSEAQIRIISDDDSERTVRQILEALD